MAYRAKAKSIVQAVTRAAHWLRDEGISIHSASYEACRGTKVNKHLTYVETAEFEDAKRVTMMLKLHGSIRAAVIAGRYERAPTW